MDNRYFNITTPVNGGSVEVPVSEGVSTLLTGSAYRFTGTNYKLGSINAAINLVRAKGSLKQTVIFYNNTKVEIILDDSIMGRNQDKAFYTFGYSDSFQEWADILNKQLSQKEFVDFLKRRPAEELSVTEPLLAQVQNLRLMTQIIGEYQYDNDDNTVFMFKTKDGEGKAKLPKSIILGMAIFRDSELFTLVELELELKKPKSETEKPLFIVSCPRLKQYIREAADYEVDIMKKALPEHLILAGSITG